MATTFIRRLAASAAVMALGMAAACPPVAAQGEAKAADHERSRPAWLTAGEAHAAERRRQSRPPESADAEPDWPTDDFGRPLRGCDVPWDLVPGSGPGITPRQPR